MSRLRAITRKPVYLAIALALVAAGVTAAGLSLRSRDPARSVVLSEDPSPEADDVLRLPLPDRIASRIPVRHGGPHAITQHAVSVG